MGALAHLLLRVNCLILTNLWACRCLISSLIPIHNNNRVIIRLRPDSLLMEVILNNLIIPLERPLVDNRLLHSSTIPRRILANSPNGDELLIVMIFGLIGIRFYLQ